MSGDERDWTAEESITREALEGHGLTVSLLLSLLDDEDLEGFYLAWTLVGTRLSSEMLRRTNRELEHTT